MDLMLIIIIVVIAFAIFTVCGYCCKKSKGGIVTGPPVTVTTAHVTATPVVQPPYPVDARHPTPQVPHPMSQPMPQSMQPPGLGFGDYPVGYQTAPYPPAAPGHHMAPYPPAQSQAAAPPPSYNEAMSQPIVQPPQVSEHYAKQSPYNPNY